MIASISKVKSWFSRGFIPTEAQYHAWIDSFFHKNESVPVAQIDGLQDLLDQKADIGTINAIVLVSVSEQEVNIGINTILAMPIEEPSLGTMYEFELWYKSPAAVPAGNFSVWINASNDPLKINITNQIADAIALFKGKMVYYNDAWRGIIQMGSSIEMVDFLLTDAKTIEIMVASPNLTTVKHAFIKKLT